MNEKFWKLSKDKQDNMINGSLKVFALNGFKHASTDEIVAEAGISKGLLFHYFYNKIGLYEFLAEYSARFALVELNSELRRKDTLPLFRLLESISRSEASAMRRYPYLYLFLSTAVKELDENISANTRDSLSLYTERIRSLLEISVLPDSMSQADAVRIEYYTRLVRTDIMASLHRNGNFGPEKYLTEASETILYFEKLFS